MVAWHTSRKVPPRSRQTTGWPTAPCLEGRVINRLNKASDTWHDEVHYFLVALRDIKKGEPLIWYVVSCGASCNVCTYRYLTFLCFRYYGTEFFTVMEATDPAKYASILRTTTLYDRLGLDRPKQL